MKPYPSQSEMHDLFTYIDGELFWKKCRGGVDVSKPAGTMKERGYIDIKINRSLFKAHRLIYIMHYGNIDGLMVDHKKGLSNKIENLRACTQAQNSQNSKMKKSNTSGFKGVNWKIKQKVWEARITVGGKRKCLGYFDDAEVANQVLKIERLKHHGEYACHG